MIAELPNYRRPWPVWLRRSLLIYAQFCLFLFFGKTHLRRAKDSRKKAQIYFSNHHCGFLDVFVLLCRLPKVPLVLMRAKEFQNPRFAALLFRLGCVPVYREDEGRSAIKNNLKIFHDLAQRLEAGESLFLFPEGTHQGQVETLPFRSALKRLLLNLFELRDEVSVRSAYLHYGDYFHSRSGIWVWESELMDVKKEAFSGRTESLLPAMEALLQDLIPASLFEEAKEKKSRSITRPTSLVRYEWKLEGMARWRQALSVLLFPLSRWLYQKAMSGIKDEQFVLAMKFTLFALVFFPVHSLLLLMLAISLSWPYLVAYSLLLCLALFTLVRRQDQWTLRKYLQL